MYTKRMEVNEMLTVVFLGNRVVFFSPLFLCFPTVFHKYMLTLKLEKSYGRRRGPDYPYMRREFILFYKTEPNSSESSAWF